MISEKSIWKNQVRRTGFLIHFELDFYCLCSLQKSILKFIFVSCSNLIFPTWFFENLVQINRGWESPKLLVLGRHVIGQISFKAFWVFSANLSAPILLLWVPCPCFLLINHYFYKKLSLYIQIQKIHLGVGVEFKPERIRNLVTVWP